MRIKFTYLENVSFATRYETARRFFVPLLRAAYRTSFARSHWSVRDDCTLCPGVSRLQCGWQLLVS